MLFFNYDVNSYLHSLIMDQLTKCEQDEAP